MDPLLLEALRFGVAILAGGITAVVAQRLAFRHALELQRSAEAERDDALRRGLIAEIRENMQRLGGPEPASMPGAAVRRVAWDAAHSLALTSDAFHAVVRAYAAGEQVSRVVELVARRALAKGFVASRSEEIRLHDAAVEILKRDAAIAFGAFRDALVALGEPLIQIGAPRVMRDLADQTD
jgi:hypothetical protein